MTEAPAAPTHWATARVVEVTRPGPSAVILRLDLPGRAPHRPGQHYVLRLTAADGYRTSRSYSLASPPEDPLLELYVGRLEDGEVSPYLADVVEPGDPLEIRGPIGGWFAWDGTSPAVGVGGGTGVVPLVSMLRHARLRGRPDLFSLVASARTPELLPYAAELVAAGATVALTRTPAGTVSPPEGGRPGVSGADRGGAGAGRAGDRPPGRLRADDLAPLVRPGATWFVCGPSGFVGTVGGLLADLGVGPADIRVERFGPSGP